MISETACTYSFNARSAIMNDGTLSATGVIGGQAFYVSNNDGIRDTDTPSNINGVDNSSSLDSRPRARAEECSL